MTTRGMTRVLNDRKGSRLRSAHLLSLARSDNINNSLRNYSNMFSSIMKCRK